MYALTENLAIADGNRRTWPEWLQSARFDLAHVCEKRLVFLVENAGEALQAVALAVDQKLDFGIIESSRVTDAVAQRMDESGMARIELKTGAVANIERAMTRLPGRISVMTSGTTGLLKSIEHNWTTLNTLSRIRESRARFWFVPYQIGSYAWYQMVCLGLFSPQQDLYCGSVAKPVENFVEALKAGVTAISSTPTFWRYALLNVDETVIRSSKLETISMGGEIVDQGILDRLSQLFPDAAIRHIFASSEAGAAIVVTDRQAGFPISRLNDESEIGVKVEDGRLYIRSPYTTAAAGGRSDEWVNTGDLVDVRDERVYFLGREESSMINVGGLKASPADIEAQLIKHPNVLWAQVYARRAPFIGSLPAARVVLKDTAADATQSERDLSGFAREHLAEHAVPRYWEFLNEIPLKPSMKS